MQKKQLKRLLVGRYRYKAVSHFSKMWMSNELWSVARSVAEASPRSRHRVVVTSLRLRVGSGLPSGENA